MLRLNELREQKANKVGEMRALVEMAEREKRGLNEGETGRFDALKGECSGLEVRISQAETLATLDRHAEAHPIGNHGHGGAAELEARFSIGRAVAEFLDTGKLTGAEGEYAREHRTGRQGGFAAPVGAFLAGERRAVLTTSPVGGPGGNLVPTNLGSLIERPRPNLAVQKLGATILSGLTGNLELPRMKSSGSVGWVGEHQEGPQDDPAFDKVGITPHTVTGNYEMSRRMLIQAPQIEQILRADIGQLLAQALDQAAVLGAGTANVPRGIRSTPGVRKVTGVYQDPNKPTVQEIDTVTGTMTALVDTANISGSTGFLSSPLVKGYLNRLRDANGGVIGGAGMFKDEPSEFSTQVPSNLGVTGDRSMIFYGNWSDLIVAYFSSVDIVLNPYADSIARKGGALLHAFLDADIAVRHPESFLFTDNFPTGNLAVTS